MGPALVVVFSVVPRECVEREDELGSVLCESVWIACRYSSQLKNLSPFPRSFVQWPWQSNGGELVVGEFGLPGELSVPVDCDLSVEHPLLEPGDDVWSESLEVVVDGWELKVKGALSVFPRPSCFSV